MVILTPLLFVSTLIRKVSSIISGSRSPFEEASSLESRSSDEEERDDPVLGQVQPSSTGTEVEQLVLGIEKIIANLFKLSTMIRKGNVHHDRLEKSSKIDVSHYEPYDIQHTKTKFPEANETLMDRLGKANSRRRQYLKYRETHHEMLAKPSTALEYDSEHREGVSRPVSIGQSTEASTFMADKAPEPFNLESDENSVAGTNTSYATSISSEEQLRVPPIPISARDGLDFECPYCYTICRLNGSEDWQRREEWK